VPPDLLAKAVQDGREAGFYKANTDTSRLLVTP
jgi:hypothetical protein